MKGEEAQQQVRKYCMGGGGGGEGMEDEGVGQVCKV